MRLRVTATMRKQLEVSRDCRGKILHGGVMIVPSILSADAFDALAGPMQDDLINHTRGIFEPPKITQGDPGNVTERYKPDATGAGHLPLPSAPQAVDSNIAHHAANREYGRRTRESALEAIRHKEEQVRRATTRIVR